MEDLRAEVERIQADIAAERSRPPGPVLDLSNLPTDCPQCIEHILKAMPPKSEHFNFNKSVMHLVTYFKAKGYTLEGALGIAGDFLQRYPHSETYDTPQKRIEHFRSQWDYLGKSNGYKFDCGFILGLRLPGSAFDCKVCAVKRNEQTTTTAEPEQSRKNPSSNTPPAKSLPPRCRPPTLVSISPSGRMTRTTY